MNRYSAILIVVAAIIGLTAQTVNGQTAVAVALCATALVIHLREQGWSLS